MNTAFMKARLVRSVCDCSLFAVEAGAGQVFACDCSSTMIQIATDVMQANGASGKVTLINKHSTDIIIPTDMPAR
jgi:ubiquinone/menaquinone biosynthesis C-methylase UbiE